MTADNAASTPWAEQTAQVVDIDEGDRAIEAEKSQDRDLRILGIESIDLVERGFNCECAMLIEGSGSAEFLVSLKHEDPVPGLRVNRAGGQAAKPGAYYDRIELPGHGQPHSKGGLAIRRALRASQWPRRIDPIAARTFCL